MQKKLAAFAATAALTIAALAGTSGAADAAAAPAAGVHPASVTAHTQVGAATLWRHVVGPFYIPQNCVTYVQSINELGVWDCEYYDPGLIPGQNPGWYATSPWYSG